MANEVTFNGSIVIRSGFLNEQIQPGSITIDLASDIGDGGVQAIGHSAHEALPTANAGDGGLYFFRNLDPTNFIEVGLDDGGSFVPFLKLLPGEYSIGRLSDSAIYAKADAAESDLQYRMLSA
jgi:hypothetical protein